MATKPKAEVEITAQNRMRRAFDDAQRQLKGLDRTAQLATRAFAGLASVGIGREMVQMADRAQQLENRLRLVTDSTAELETVQGRLFTVAQQTRSQFEGTVDLYARVARATEEIGLSESRRLAVTRAVNQAIQVSNASTAAAEAALIQLSQGLASGTLRGEELNSVLEQTPRLAQAIADGMGITIGQLRTAGKEGRLTAETVITAIENQAGTINSEFEKMEGTVGQAVTNLGNSMLNLVGKMDDATGASGALAAAIRGVSRAIDEAAELAAKDWSTGIDAVDIALKRVALSALENANPAAAAVLNIGRAFADMANDAEAAAERAATAMKAFPTFDPTGGSQGAVDMLGEIEVAAKRLTAAAAESKSALEQITLGSNELIRRMPTFDPTGGEENRARRAEEQAERAAEAAREIEQLRQFTLTREQVELEAHMRRMEILRTRFDEGHLLETEFRQLSIDLAARTQERLNEITQAGLTERQKFEQMAAQQKAATVLGNIANITAGVAQSNKTLFKINKAAALAHAIVALPPAIIETFKNNGGWPWGAVAAAAMAAAGLAQIQAIKSTSFGGGTTPSLAGTTGSVGGQPVPQQLPQLPTQDAGRGQTIVNVTVTGIVGRIEPEQARQIGEAIKEQIDGADFTIMSSTSRQAQDLRSA